MRVALLDDYQDVAFAVADWKSGLPGAEVVAFKRRLSTREELLFELRGFDVVVAMRERTPFPREVLEGLPDLRLLVTTGRRNAAIDVAAAAERGIVVCGTGSRESPPAELAWGLLLAVARSIPLEDASVRAGGWQRTVGIDLDGKTLGLLGLGRLGGRVAQYGLAFGMDVAAWSPNLTAERAQSVGARLVTREELFAGSDFLSIHLVLGQRSRGLVGERELRLMRPTAILVNTSRGPIVDEAALVKALRDGWIAGAGLDVFDDEPLPADHPLRSMPRTVLTPHLGYVTEANYRVFYGEAIEDIKAFAAGAPIRVITPSR